MNLIEALALSKRKERKPAVAKRRQKGSLSLAKDRMILAEKEGRMFDGKSEDEVANMLFASTQFTLMELPLNKLASPGPQYANNLVRQITAEGIKNEPIVVDANVNKIGRSLKTGFYPPVIVVDGKERFEAAMVNGEERILCWVGSLAASHIEIHADHQIGTEELQSMLYEAIKNDLGITNKNNYDAGLYIQNVYPLENYCIYKYKGTSWRQKYVCDLDSRACTLVGPPKAVVQKWQDSDLKATGTLESSMQACACQEASADFFARKDGKPVPLKACMDGYMKSNKGKMKARSIEAKSPPGWSKTTEKMKEHADIDNPWALAWWMHEQGYEPRYKEKK